MVKQGNGYKTRQSELVLHILMQQKDRHLAAEDVVDQLKAQGTAVSKATVYRHLDRLVEQNLVRRYHMGEGAGACYQYCGDDPDRHLHYHLKCVTCGELFHVSCEYLDTIAAHIWQEHRFRVDSSRTVLYGQCEHCREQEKEGEDSQ